MAKSADTSMRHIRYPLLKSPIDLSYADEAEELSSDEDFVLEVDDVQVQIRDKKKKESRPDS